MAIFDLLIIFFQALFQVQVQDPLPTDPKKGKKNDLDLGLTLKSHGPPTTTPPHETTILKHEGVL